MIASVLTLAVKMRSVFSVSGVNVGVDVAVRLVVVIVNVFDKVREVRGGFTPT